MVNLTASQHLANHNFYPNYLLYPQTHRFVIWSHRSCRLLRCHGNGCSWYSAILIICTAKYQAWMDNYLC